MGNTQTVDMRPRLNLGKSNSRNDARFSVDDMVRPHLVEILLSSYHHFLYGDGETVKSGLQEAFEFAFPIVSNSGHMVVLQLQFEYAIFDIEECKMRGLTYSSSLKLSEASNI